MRTRSSLLVGAYCDSVGAYWKSLRDALPYVARRLGVDAEGKKRSQLAIECAHEIEARGISIPPDFVPPWSRCVYVGSMPAINRANHRRGG